ncbi:hypothetical protein D3C83_124390 [compost metagenome]
MSSIPCAAATGGAADAVVATASAAGSSFVRIWKGMLSTIAVMIDCSAYSRAAVLRTMPRTTGMSAGSTPRPSA